MSLMRTLAKVAIGVAVAKGASAMMKNRGGGGAEGGASGGLGGLLGGLAGGLQGAGQSGSGGGAASGGLDDMLGGLLGGGQGGAGGAGGLGGLLEGLGGGSGGAGPRGLEDMLGGLAGAAGAGGLLGGLSGALGGQKAPEPNNSNFGQVLNSQFDQTPEPAIPPSADQEAMAALLLRAMIQATKADGQLDPEEEKKLMGHLEADGNVDPAEVAFVRGELSSPVDVHGLVEATPRGMGPQVYAMSLMAIDLDSQPEAQYLHDLAEGFGLGPKQVNDIHAQLGVPSLYA